VTSAAAAREESRVGDVKQFGGIDLLRDGDVQVAGDLQDRSRVIPGSTELPSGAVCSAPLRTMKTFLPEPSLT